MHVQYLCSVQVRQSTNKSFLGRWHKGNKPRTASTKNNNKEIAMPGFNYDGQGSTSMGLNKDPYVRDGNGTAVGIKPGYHGELAGTGPSEPTTIGPNGEYRINITQAWNAVPDTKPPVSSNGGSGGSDSGSAGSSLVMKDGQMGYWIEKTLNGAERDRTVRVFVPVGPSEADKKAAADKLAQETQQAESAAKAFAAQLAAASLAAEQVRKQAIAAAAAAGQHQSVSQAQSNLDTATQDAARLKSVADNTLNQARSKRQAASAAAVAAAQAEQAYQGILQAIESKRPRGQRIVTKNGMLGYEESRTRDTANRTLSYVAFVSIDISVAQRDNAQADAVNKRNLANQLSVEASNLEQASLRTSSDYNSAETRRQAALAALNAAKQAEALAIEAERQRQAAEAAAIAAEEQRRQAEEAAKAAEEARIAAEQEKAQQARQAVADRLKANDIQSVRGIAATAAPSAFPLSWSVAAVGGITLDSEVAGVVWSRIATILAELRGIATASMAGPVAAVIATLFYSEEAGVGSDLVPGRDLSALMPGDALSLPDAVSLDRAADTQGTVAMSVRGRLVMREDGTLETQLVRTEQAGSVPVVRGILDKETGFWGYSIPAMPGVPAQTILVSPADAPGAKAPLGLTGPVPVPETIVHTGGQANIPTGINVTTSPVAEDLDFNDLVLVFPAESGLKPLYVMLRSPRNMPGTAKGKGQPVGENWLSGVGSENGVPIPSQVAGALNGKDFSSFDQLRGAIWTEISKYPELTKNMNPGNKKLVEGGYSPFVRESEQVGGREKHELHHVELISEGGDVYDLDNLRIVTPKRHIEIHKEGK